MNTMLKSLLAASFLALAVSASAADKTDSSYKIGYVVMDRILQEAPQVIEINKKLEKEIIPRRQELEKIAKQIKDTEASLEKDGLTMAEADRRNKERDIANAKLEFQRKQREFNEDLNLRKNDEFKSFEDRINKAVTGISETEGYDIVLFGPVGYFSKRVDITDKVLKALGKK
ncbi:MAG TPA: OmpH family outer membrane protein [Methylophilaceae bacterium]|nr:OmpH family outer membrane protein [Methylophilaceae bacterium]